MGSKLARSNQFKPSLKPSFRWGQIASIALLIAGAGVMPASADQLEAWGYDSQARSLTLVLPPNVAPTLSVLGPNRLRVELPNTQVGEVAAQTVADGVVEGIALEQATPDTVWLIVEFAEGVVLADAQSAVPTTTTEGLQQWQVRPVLTNDSAANVLTAQDLPPVTNLEPGAQSLQTEPSAIALSPAELAQIPDFPELPLLEPAIPLSEPVSVPPIAVPPVAQPVDDDDDAAPAEAAPTQAEVSPLPAEVAPTAEVAPAAEIMPAETPTVSEAALPTADLAPAPPPADSREEAIVVGEPEEFLFDPPFLEDVAAPEIAPEIASPEPPTADPAPLANVPVADATVDAPPTAEPAAPAEVSVPIVELPTESVTPANVSRWPDPIPFGQPLP